MTEYTPPSIGIDPGVGGGMAILWPTGKVRIITYEEAQTTGFDAWTLLFSTEPKLVIEHVQGQAGDTPRTAFILGMTYGFWQAVISGTGKREALTEIRPEIWQTRFARQFGERWCPRDRKARKKFIHDKMKEVFGSEVTLAMADAVALAWLKSKGVI